VIRKASLDDIAYALGLARKGDDSYADATTDRLFHEVEKKWANVLNQLGHGAFPTATSMHVNHGLVKINGKEVYVQFNKSVNRSCTFGS